MGESRVLSGRGCQSVKGEGSQSLMCTAESCGDGMAMVRGNIGSGIVSCGEGGEVLRLGWLVMAASMILTAVSSLLVMVGEEVGVVMVVVGNGKMLFLCPSCPSFICLWVLLQL